MLLQAYLLAVTCAPQVTPPPAENNVDSATRERITVAISGARAADRLHRGFDEGLAWFRGASYKAFADEKGFTYVPFFGSKAPRSFPVHVRLASVRNGEHEVGLADGALRPRGGHVEIDRGPVTVRYRMAAVEAEQLIVFDGLGEVLGDVQFSADYTSDLELVQDEGGLRFLGDLGEVRVGGAVALDGRGGSLPLALSVTGSTVTYRIPAWFARAAGEGLVVDPLITTATAADVMFSDLREPDVAYDAGTNTYAVVATDQYSATDTDIYTTLLDGSTLDELHTGWLEVAGTAARRPRVCSLPGPGRFICAFLKEDQAGLHEILVRERDTDGGPGSNNAWSVPRVAWSHDEFFDPGDHDIGGELYAGPDPFAMLTWRSNARGGSPFPSQIRARRVDPDARPVGTAIDITSLGGSLDHGAPSISKFAGDPALHNAWWITYPAGPLGGAFNELWAARIRFNGSITESSRQVFQVAAGRNLGSVDVSAPYDTADVTEAVHFTASVISGGAQRTYVATRERGTVGVPAPPEVMGEVDIHGSAANSGGALCTFVDRAVVAYGDRVQSTDPTSIVASTIERERGGGAAVGERRVPITTLGSSGSTTPSLASSYSGGDPQASDRALAVWTAPGTGTLDIFAALLSFPEPRAIGENFCVGTRNSSGDFGFLSAYGDNSIGAPKTLRATELPANQFGFFVVSRSTGSTFPANSVGRLCLTGSVGRYNGSVLNSGADGEFEFTVDPTALPISTGVVSAAPGETWSFQAWHRDSLLSPTSNFTSGVRITF